MTHRTLMGLTLTALVEGLVGCGLSGSPSTLPAPSPISQRPAVHPTTSVSIISGFVLDTGFRPVVGARVEVVNGSQAGTFTTAGADGQFSLSGAFDAGSTFRASQDGYVAATQGWTCSTGLGTCPANGANPWLGFYLDVLVAPVDITGNYTLTFIADSACSDLPSELRTRTYGATITPSQPGNPLHTSLNNTISGAPFLGSFRSFGIGVAGHYLGFWLDGGHDPPLVEQVAQNSYLAFSGVAAASVGTSASAITTSFDGWIEYCVMPSPMGAAYNCGTSNTTGDPIPRQAITRAHCESKNHQLILTRR